MTRGRLLPTALVLASAAISAQQAPVQVPLVGCETGGQVAMELPNASSVSVPNNPGIAAKLAYYAAGNGLGILAPRGWYCFGTVGSGGDQLSVTPKPIDKGKYFSNAWSGFEGPVVHIIHRIGGTSGRFSVAEVIMRVFPDRRAFAEGVAESFPWVKEGYAEGPYPGDRLTYKSTSVVEYVTPAQEEGLGTYWGLLKGDSSINGVAILIGGPTPDLVLSAVRLPAGFADAVSAIVHQVERDTERHAERLGLRSFKP